jgi:nucleoside-diphosphate-sugar epimerase
MYGMGKHMIEDLCYMYSKRYNLSAIALRFATVWFDPGFAIIGRETTLDIPNMTGKDMVSWYREQMLRMSRHEPLQANERDLAAQYVGHMDIVQGCRLALENEGIKYAVYNLGADESGSELDSLEIAGLYYPGVPIRNPELFLANPKKPLFDITKAQKDLGYKPRFHWKDWGK